MRHPRTILALAAVTGALSLPTLALSADAPPDAWLTTKSKLAVLTDVGVEGTDIDVDSVRGVVTLHGTVASEEDQQTAEKAVRGLDGVGEVRNLIQVVPPAEEEDVAASDDEIGRAISSKLADDSGIENAEIEVQSVNDGTVLLAGEAPDLLVHLRAIEIARDVPGVKEVASQIVTPDDAGDAIVWKRIAAGADMEGMSPDREDSAEASQAASADENAAAAETKSATADAEDTAELAWDGLTDAATDAYVTAAVKSRLLVDSRTPGTDINVDTENGVVTLFGTVESEEAKEAAEKNAMEAAGVERVENELEVAASSDEKS